MTVTFCDRCGEKINGFTHPTARRVLLTRELGNLRPDPNLFLCGTIVTDERPNLEIDFCHPCLRTLVQANTYPLKNPPI